MLKELTLVLLVVLCHSKIEYYSKLGLNRGASAQEIKRAFKRLATKYHPDRAPASQKEEHNRLFSEISDAYSVLSDPELKQHYDNGGHDALERHRQHQEYHNQHKARQEFHDSMITDHFANTDLTVLNINTLSRFYRRSQVWLVLFYRSQDPEMRSGLKEAILELNSKFYGIFTVAAVNCDQDDGICDEYRASNTPDILGFKSEVTHDGERFTGDKVSPKTGWFCSQFDAEFRFCGHA
jgi:curved DNA-binding protein CbpA